MRVTWPLSPKSTLLLTRRFGYPDIKIYYQAINHKDIFKPEK